MKSLFLLLLLAEGCGDPKPQTPCNFFENKQHQRIAWDKQSLPVTVYIDDSLYPEYKIELYNAMIKWNGFRNLFTATNDPSSANVVIYIDDSSIRPNESGYTNFYSTGSRMYHANVFVRTPATNTVDKQSLFLHELGHTLGLDHNTDLNSVMQPVLGSGIIRNTIGQVDFNSLSCEY